MSADIDVPVPNRRVTRSRRRASQYEPLDKEEERHLRAALKRSKLEHSMTASGAPDVPEAPTHQPSVEEFNDPIRLWERLHEYGSKYGAVKLVPPAGWRPPCAMELDKLIFEAREQHLHKLANGRAFSFPKNVWTAKA
eukprot:Selendium_serpulae@DN12119_c0_g1_i1.p1